MGERQSDQYSPVLTGMPVTLCPGSPFSPWSPGNPGIPLSPWQKHMKVIRGVSMKVNHLTIILLILFNIMKTFSKASIVLLMSENVKEQGTKAGLETLEKGRKPHLYGGPSGATPILFWVCLFYCSPTISIYYLTRSGGSLACKKIHC